MPPLPTLEEVRSWFPALDSGFAFLENAGGSQLPRTVIEGVQNHLTHNMVQLGAGYPASDRATGTVERAHEFVGRMMGGEGKGLTILGSSTTQLLHMLAGCYAKVWKSGAVVLTETAH